MIRNSLLVALTFILLAAAVSCSGEEPVSRQEVLVSLTDDVIVPRYRVLSEKADALRSSLHSLCEQPTQERLEVARTAWRDTRSPWLRTQAAWFGPIMDRRSRSFVDWSPVEPERIEVMLAKRDSVTAYDVRELLASTQRGLGAIEYVIFEEDRVVLEKLGSSDSPRCQYISALGDVVAEETAAVLGDWIGNNPEGKAFAGFFNGSAENSLLAKSAVNDTVSNSIFLIRRLGDMGLGKALGVEDTEPDPSAIPGGAGHNRVADLKNQVLGMQDVYIGANDPDRGELGVSALLRGVSEDADLRVRDAFTDTLSALDGLSEPLPETMRQNPEPAHAAYLSIKELEKVFNADIVSLLGVTVGFADTDGDGG